MLKRVVSIHSYSTEYIRAYLRMPLFRNGYALMVSGGATAVLGVLFWALATRYYPADIVGLNSALISAMTFLAGVSQLSMVSVVIRFVPTAGSRTPKVVAAIYALCIGAALLVGAVSAFGLGSSVPALAMLRAHPALGLWFMLAVLAWSMFVLQDAVLTSLRQAIWVPVENIIFAVAKIGLLILFARAYPEQGIFASWVVPMLILIVPINFAIFRSMIPKHVAATRHAEVPVTARLVASYAGGNYLALLFSLAYSTLLPVLVTQRAGAEANGFFFLPWMISNTLQIVGINLTTSMTVEAASDLSKLASYTRRVLIHLAQLVLPLVSIVLVGAPLILRVFGDSYTAEGTAVLRLLAIATVPNVINILAFGIARVQRRLRALVIGQGSLCAMVLGLSYVLVGRYGINGVGIGWLISQSVTAIFMMLFLIWPLLRHAGARAAH